MFFGLPIKAAKLISILFIHILICSSLVHGENTRDIDVLAHCLGLESPIGRQFLVLIAINAYRSFPPLKRPRADAEALKKILEDRYYYDGSLTRTLCDDEATKENILTLFARLQKEIREEDSLLIFFAGHGEEDIITNTYFWIPVDGDGSKTRQTNWIPHSQVKGALCRIKARHILLIADSCFSGELLSPLRGGQPKPEDGNIDRQYSLSSRLVLTSGSSEYVPDNGDFSKRLLTVLGASDGPYTDSLSLYNDIRLGVKATSPLYGGLLDCGHQQGGVFPFFRRIEGSGSIDITAKGRGKLFIDGEPTADIDAGATRLSDVKAGAHVFIVKYDDDTEEPRTAIVTHGALTKLEFIYIPKAGPSDGPVDTEDDQNRARTMLPVSIMILGSGIGPFSAQSSYYPPSAAWNAHITYRLFGDYIFSVFGIMEASFFSHSSSGRDVGESTLSVCDMTVGMGLRYALPFFKPLGLRADAGLGYALSFFDYADYSDLVISGDTAVMIRIGADVRTDPFILFVHATYLGIMYKDLPLYELSFGGGIGFLF